MNGSVHPEDHDGIIIIVTSIRIRYKRNVMNFMDKIEFLMQYPILRPMAKAR